MKTLTLEKDYSIKLSSNIVDFIYPDYVFVPMDEGYKLKVKNNEIVKKEQILLENDDNVCVFSPISGKVVGAKECLLADGVGKKCIVLENDFKEKMLTRTTMRKNIKQIKKEEFYNILTSKGVLDANDSNKLLVDIFKNDNFNKIIVRGFEEEPYIATKLFLLQKNYDVILETISYLGKLFNTNANIIVLKNNDRENIEIYSNILGTYPEINLNLVPDVYPLNDKTLLNKYLRVEDNNCLVVTPENIIAIYNVLMKNKLITEKYITITGDAIENPIVVNAKIGSSLKKIILENVKFLSNDEVLYIVNGLMTGLDVDIEDLIVTSELEGIIINFKKEYKEHACINCGKCLEVCPVNIDPKLCFLKRKNTNDSPKCIDCGLCTYICPAFINFKNRIKEVKNEK